VRKNGEFADKRKVTRREKFLAEMERAVPWKVFADMVAALSEGGQWPQALPAGSDAAHPLHAAVVQSVGSGHGRGALRQHLDTPLPGSRSRAAAFQTRRRF